MKNYLFVATTFLALGTAVPALAADLAARPYTKAPSAIATTYNWSGFYLGLNGGAAWSRDCWFSVNQNLGEGCNSPTGGMVGGQVGFNWQWQSLVLGVEGSGDWAGLSAGHLTTSPFTNPAAHVILNGEINHIESVTGRIGAAFNNVLVYGKGGAAWIGSKYNENAFGVLATAANATQSGWVAGVGVEYGFSPNISAALEYDYYDFGNPTLPFTAVATQTFAFNEKISEQVQAVTVRLNYRFNPF